MFPAFQGSTDNGAVDLEFTPTPKVVERPSFTPDVHLWTSSVEDRLQAAEARIAELSKRLVIAQDIIDRQHQRLMKLEAKL